MLLNPKDFLTDLAALKAASYTLSLPTQTPARI